MTWNTLVDWFMELGRDYGVNPIVFGSIYVGAIPFFMLSVAQIVRNLGRGLPILLPALSASFFFISAYLYLLVAGHGIPAWVYGIIILMAAGGAYSTLKKIRDQSRSKRVDSQL